MSRTLTLSTTHKELVEAMLKRFVTVAKTAISKPEINDIVVLTPEVNGLVTQSQSYVGKVQDVKENTDTNCYHLFMSFLDLADTKGWIPVDVVFPPQDGYLIGYSPEWVDLDCCPDGVREFYVAGDAEEFDLYSQKWSMEHDCYDSLDELDGGMPTHWRYKVQYLAPDFKSEPVDQPKLD